MPPLMPFHRIGLLSVWPLHSFGTWYSVLASSLQWCLWTHCRLCNDVFEHRNASRVLFKELFSTALATTVTLATIVWGQPSPPDRTQRTWRFLEQLPVPCQTATPWLLCSMHWTMPQSFPWKCCSAGSLKGLRPLQCGQNLLGPLARAGWINCCKLKSQTLPRRKVGNVCTLAFVFLVFSTIQIVVKPVWGSVEHWKCLLQGQCFFSIFYNSGNNAVSLPVKKLTALRL